MSRFFSTARESLLPYTPGEQPQEKGLIKLNTNESPYPPCPNAAAVLLAGDKDMPSEIASLRLYSDPLAGSLIRAIADFYGIRCNQVMAGNGSDEILAFAVLAFCDDKTPLCFPDLTYGFYPVLCRLFGIPYSEIPLEEDFTIAIEKFRNCKGNVVLANPNAPTGLAVPLSAVKELLEQDKDRIVLIDEAYVDFGSESAVSLIERYNNLVVVQTFSKSRSLAGGRVGFALANPALIEDLNRIKYSFNPYNINRLSMLAAAEAMKDREYFQSCVGRICATRDKTADALEKLGFTVLPSKTNFLFVRSPVLSGKEYFDGLRNNKILVRRWDISRIEDYVRISVGSEEEMGQLLKVTEKLILEKKREMEPEKRSEGGI